MPANIRTRERARFPNLAPAPGVAPVTNRRYRGPTVALYEWHCRGHGETHPTEEWTDGYEVVVPRRGAFQWEIAGERLLADPGSASFLHPGEPYRVRHPVVGGDAGSVFQVGESAVRALVEPHDPAAAGGARARFPCTHAAIDGRAYLLHRLAVRAAGDPAATPLEVEERATAFLREVVAQGFRRRGMAAGRRASPAGENRLAAEYASRVAEVVAARYRERLTLAAVARAVGASHFHLSRLVTAATGVPIYRMVLRLRLREAMERLLDTRDSVSRIALAVGFASHSHLTDRFRREFGVTPSQVREAGRVKGEG